MKKLNTCMCGFRTRLLWYFHHHIKECKLFLKEVKKNG